MQFFLRVIRLSLAKLIRIFNRPGFDTVVWVDPNGELYSGYLELGRNNVQLVVVLIFNFLYEVMNLDSFLGRFGDVFTFENKELIILSGRNLHFGHFLRRNFLTCDLTSNFR